MNIITSGYPYIDIDAYAGCIAYAELLNLLGQPSLAVSTAPLNESITPEVLSWQAPLETTYVSSPSDRFIMIDLCNPQYFEKFVAKERVSEIIDHHPGFESYWRDKPGVKAQIEPIGAVATIIYERWASAERLDKMSQTSARLLLTAILDNTLNFGAKITHQRDKTAYDALLGLANLPSNWTEKYFLASQTTIVSDITAALANDTKILPFKTFPRPVAVGQMVVWDARDIMKKHETNIIDTLESYNYPWFLNLVSVQEKRSYFMCQNPQLQLWLHDFFDVEFDGIVVAADRLWLRKEIIQQDIIVK